MRGSRLDRGDGIRGGDIGIIVAVNAEDAVEPLANDGENFSQAARERAAVGITEAEDIRAGVLCRFEGAESEIGIGEIAVEEVFRVVDYFLSVRLEVRNGF